ncbi:prephenate dehydratase domain-containing protein [Hydrogenoanaerobacterium sp.]|uniref:bifunctional chorismate mutase/prephenate dehydratase n=1 Tax=Hydrogenoanaerobacterium sp. TaxID=2953763 RepID=UPI00289B5184|nr:prephenate dehydratase domain-containing protein [Hydrogenoanaerobacterium sp.]
MDLQEMRLKIDEIDEQIVSLFKARMNIVHGVAEYKRQNNLSVLHTGREKQVLDRVAALAGAELADSTRFLFTTIMDLSKAQQNNQLTGTSPLSEKISHALQVNKELPKTPVIACQGVDGAYSSIAARKMFSEGKLHFHQNFADIFRCVKNGECEIGILPIENSTAGSVNNVYDLMKQYRFHIVRGLKLEVSHCLLAKRGVSLDEITDIYSHEQAISQCENFLQAHPNIRVHLYSNTAAAARFVSECGDRGVAAIASRECAAIYHLDVVLDEIKSAERNYTRFIAISNDMILTDDADKMSIALTLPHEAGSLYKLITQFSMLELNLTKLESRPLPDTDFEFLFYFDFSGNLANEQIIKLLTRLEQQCEYFEFLGNYHEL